MTSLSQPIIAAMLTLCAHLAFGAETVLTGVMGTEISDAKLFYPINLVEFASATNDNRQQISNVVFVHTREGTISEESKKDFTNLSVRIAMRNSKGEQQDYAFARIVDGRMRLMFNNGENNPPEVELSDAPVLFSEILSKLPGVKVGESFAATVIDMRERRADVWTYTKRGAEKISDMDRSALFVDAYSVVGKHGDIGSLYVSQSDNSLPIRSERIWRDKMFVTYYFK